jgi:hypothetical protein
LAYLAAIVGRTSRLRLHADASGLIVLNLLRRYRVTWDEVRRHLGRRGIPRLKAINCSRNLTESGSGGAPARKNVASTEARRDLPKVAEEQAAAPQEE